MPVQIRYANECVRKESILKIFSVSNI